MLKHPCLPQHKGDAVKKASTPQVWQHGSPVPCLENRQGGVRCTWVQSRVLAPEVSRDDGLWDWASTSVPFPSLAKVLPFRSVLRLLGVLCVGQWGEGSKGEKRQGRYGSMLEGIAMATCHWQHC